jgi:thymidine phosphorylase
VLRVRPGDRVLAGDPLFELRTDDAATIPPALAAAAGAVTVADAAPAPAPLVIDRVG